MCTTKGRPLLLSKLFSEEVIVQAEKRMLTFRKGPSHSAKNVSVETSSQSRFTAPGLGVRFLTLSSCSPGIRASPGISDTKGSIAFRTRAVVPKGRVTL